MPNRKLTTTVTMSLVALAAATGAAVLQAGAATAETGTITPDPTEPPAQNVPGLTVPAQKIESIFPGLKLPTLTVPTTRIANKVPVQKIPVVLFGDIKGESGDDKH